ncbi:MAG: pyridoxal-phosphate dependent enzyme [Planctomycetota bacterium]
MAPRFSVYRLDTMNGNVSEAEITFDDVCRARELIAPYAHETPVITCSTLNRMSGHELFFKCENQQKTGAFKFRGAVNSVARLTDEEKARGVVTHSSGNHAQALAAAAKLFGVTAHIVMPSNSPQVKKAGVKGYGGRIIECEPTLESRERTAKAVKAETGAVLIPPFNYANVIAGQGTCAAEFFEQVPDIQTMIAPVGGGGLLSGTCISAAAQSPQVAVIAGEPANADDAFQSKAEGRVIPQLNPDTIADGLRTSLGSLTWPFVRDYVDHIVRIEEQEIVKAMKLFIERTKVFIEPSAAVAVAVALYHLPKSEPPARIGVILSGGNVDLDKLPW